MRLCRFLFILLMVQRMKELHTQIQDVFAAGIHEGGEDFREGGKINTAPESGVKASIVALDNGNVYVQASRKVITGTTKAQQRQNITDFFEALLDNKKSLDIHTVEGDVLTITKKDTAVKARDDYKTVNGIPTPMTNNEFAVKLRMEAHIDELAEVSQSPKNKKPIPDGKNHAFAKNGFTYRRAYFEDFDGQYYEVTLSVGHNGTVATVYNVGKIDKSTLPSAKIIAVVGSQPLGKVLSTVKYMQSGSKSQQNSLRYQKNEAAQSHMAAQDASLAEDMEGLQAFVALQKKQGRQAKMETAATNAAATFLMKTAGAKGDKAELMNLLDGFYRYVASTELQSWESVREKAMPVVRWLMKNTVRTKQRSEYAQDVLNTLHGSRVSLDETQKNEVAHIYGSFGAFRNTVMGSIILPLVLAWYIVTELGSILENAVKMGAVVPEWLIKLMKIGLRAIDEAGEKIEHEAAAVVEPNEEAQPAESSEN